VVGARKENLMEKLTQEEKDEINKMGVKTT
jgi:hypothetical protein